MEKEPFFGLPAAGLLLHHHPPATHLPPEPNSLPSSPIPHFFSFDFDHFEPPLDAAHSAHTSCYSTPLNSPPKTTLAAAAAPAIHLAERVAQFPFFLGGDGGAFPGQLLDQEEASSAPLRKRKAAAKSKGKEAPSMIVEDDSSSKRCKLDEIRKDANADPKSNSNENSNRESKGRNAKPPPEPLKDYIHVRARRGQATDSHSLAERVRREKISERMKLLQDLVPGCNKVTGKAVMLDEIINYVQSLQRQVEFLSMKLANVNPCLEFNHKDMHQATRPAPPFAYPSSAAMNAAFSFDQHPPTADLTENRGSICPLDTGLHHELRVKLPPSDGHGTIVSLNGNIWEEDLHSFVQMMGFGQSQEAASFSSQSFYGPMTTNYMKVEP